MPKAEMKKKMGTLKRVAISKSAVRCALDEGFIKYCEPTWMPMTPSMEMPRIYSMAARCCFAIEKPPAGIFV